MLVEIPFVANLTVKKTSRHKPRRGNYIRHAMVDIPFIDADDSPIVYWSHADMVDENFRICDRYYDGELYRPIISGSSGSLPFVENSAMKAVGSSFNRPAYKTFDSSILHSVTVVASVLSSLKSLPRSIVDTENDYYESLKDFPGAAILEEDDSLSVVLKFFNDVKVIDGILYQKTECPALVSKSKNTNGVSMVRGNQDLNFIHPITEYENFLNSVGRYYHFDSYEKSRPEILRPDLVSFDFNGYLLREAVREVMSFFQDPDSNLFKFDRDVIMFVANYNHNRIDPSDYEILNDLESLLTGLRRGSFPEELSFLNRVISRAQKHSTSSYRL